MANLEEVFSMKLTENGDKSFDKVGYKNPLLDILFKTEYYQKHLNEVKIGSSEFEQLFSMFVRDPRFGLGRRDLGRQLMKLSKISIDNVVKAGRFDDVFNVFGITKETLDYAKKEIENGNELVKKWMPRYSSKNLMLARGIAKYWGMTKQQYGHFIKCDTTEEKLSRKETYKIEFECVPSLAMLKYYNRFATKSDTSERFEEYRRSVEKGVAKLNISTTDVYDIYRNMGKIDPDLFFNKLEKISGNWIPIVDTSGSMCDSNDSIGKAFAIGHYLSKCSTYAKNKVISFSSRPQLLDLENGAKYREFSFEHCLKQKISDSTRSSVYYDEISRMYTGDCTNTNFGAVMELLKNLTDTPEYLIVLSDMEFDMGSSLSKTELEKLWKQNGYTTKIIWWNLNGRNQTCPEMDNMGNIYMSGYNPFLLKYLKVGFDGEKFLNTLLEEYKKI